MEFCYKYTYSKKPHKKYTLHNQKYSIHTCYGIMTKETKLSE